MGTQVKENGQANANAVTAGKDPKLVTGNPVKKDEAPSNPIQMILHRPK